MFLDFAIVGLFLVVTIFIGITSTKKIKTIEDYALGGRNFSTPVLIATLIATWFGGGSFSASVSRAYTDGLPYILASLGMSSSFFITAYVFGPRMGKFLGKLSVAEVMGSLYGKNVRIISAISALIRAVGSIAVQIKVCAFLFGYFIDLPGYWMTLISSAIVILYSTFGGIRAVTFTDVFQFASFGILIPSIGMLIWKHLDNPHTALSLISDVSVRQMHSLFNPDLTKFWGTFFLFIYFAVPEFSPAIFQRIAMARNADQIRKAFGISGIIFIIIKLLMVWVGLLLFVENQDLKSNQILGYMIDNYTYSGFKGMLIVGIVAMTMSTADSSINSSAVLFAHDICRPLKIKIKNPLWLARTFSITMGGIAVIFALHAKDLLGLVLMTASFYAPIVNAPIIFGIFGLKTSPRVVILSSAIAIISVILWRLFIMEKTGIDSVVPGMIVSVVLFALGHYLLEGKRWIKVDETEDSPESNKKKQNKTKIYKIYNRVKFF